MSVLPRCFILDGLHGSDPPGQTGPAGIEAEIEDKEKKTSPSPQADDSSWLSPSRRERGDSWLYRSRTMVGRGSFAFAGFCGHPVELAELSCRHSTLVPAFVGERVGISPALLWGGSREVEEARGQGGRRPVMFPSWTSRDPRRRGRGEGRTDRAGACGLGGCSSSWIMGLWIHWWVHRDRDGGLDSLVNQRASGLVEEGARRITHHAPRITSHGSRV